MRERGIRLAADAPVFAAAAPLAALARPSGRAKLLTAFVFFLAPQADDQRCARNLPADAPD